MLCGMYLDADLATGALRWGRVCQDLLCEAAETAMRRDTRRRQQM